MTEKSETQEKVKEKGFFSKLFLVDQTEEIVKNPTEKKVEQTPVVTPQPQPQTVVYTNPTNSVGVVNQEMYNNLKSILNECNLPGPDYLELKTASDANKSLIQDENLRLQFSYNSLKATAPKLTKKIVIESIDKYVEFIEKERVVAQKESDEVYNSEVTARQQKIDELTTTIEKSKEEIQKLNEKILLLSQEINTVVGEKLTKETELGIKKKNFDITIDTIVNELKSDKSKIETLINE
jgi:hypothetical protein